MDPISNMIISIKNAGVVGKDKVVVGYSKLKEDIAEVLKTEGFIKDVNVRSKGSKKTLLVELFINNRLPKVKGVKRISKPSKRIYTKAHDIKAVKQGYGILVLSTPQGVMAGYKAKKLGVGGEALFSIW